MSRRRVLFFFARPAPAVIPEIERLRDAPGLVRDPLPSDRLHATMGTLGGFSETPAALIADVADRLDGYVLPSFRMVLDTLVARRDRVLLKPSEALLGFDAVQRLLVVLLADIIADRGIDWRLWVRRFQPHVTLGYRGAAEAVHPIEPISWAVGRIDLVESLQGRSVHIVRKSWPLVAEAAAPCPEPEAMQPEPRLAHPPSSFRRRPESMNTGLSGQFRVPGFRPSPE